jgi:Undecaprenyl-phosphate glucose phosphotransferase
MLKKYYAVFGPALRVLDILILSTTWIAAYYLRRDYPLPLMRNAIPPFENYVGFLALILLLWGAVFNASNVYSDRRLVRRTVEAYRVLRAHAISLLIFVVLTYLFSTYRLSRGVFIYFGFLSAVLLVLVRVFLRSWLRSLRAQGLNLQKVLIAGTDAAAIRVFHNLNRHPELGLEFLGFVGALPASQSERLPLKLLGEFADTPKLVKKLGVQKIVIALSRNEYPQIDQILGKLKDEMIDVVLVPDLHEFLVLGCEVEEFDGLPMVSLNETPMSGANMVFKRIMDIVLTSTGIVLLSPVLLIIALAVKLSSKGPVLYRQERMSLNGKKFHMLKFRSMSVDQKGDVEVLTKKNDPRVTAIGKFIRKTSLDELPQLFNVLRGDMSLVGPRPERTWVVNQLRDKIPSYMLKHKVKAGITGWAQINGWRGDTSLEKRIEYDLYYIKNWSLVFDCKILLLTIIKGFINRNAY